MVENLLYDPVPGDDIVTTSLESDTNVIEPLELDLPNRVVCRDDRLFSWADPWLLTAVIIGGLMVPSLFAATILTYELTGRIWPAFLFSVHLSVGLWELWAIIPSHDLTKPAPSLCRQIFSAGMDVFLFLKLYPMILDLLIQYLFTDVDGTVIIEYSHYHASARILHEMASIFGFCRLIVETCSCCVVGYYRVSSLNSTQLNMHRCAIFERFDENDARPWSDLSKVRLRRSLRWVVQSLFFVSLGLLVWTTISIFVHWVSWPSPRVESQRCDPMDPTECVLPFPNMEFMVRDDTSDTGWRVNIHPDILPRLKGGVKLHPDFLNELDGFSTMAPLLFYLDGLKESQESGNNYKRLQGPQDIAKSVTSASVTVLLDVENRTLVPHSAEIDYLDQSRPIVMVFPSKPFLHNHYYALAVLGARDAQGEILPPSPGLDELLSAEQKDSPRSIRFREKILPALQEAAPWSQSETIQLLFDFHTISDKSQLGIVRAVRDATLKEIDSEDWEWKKHVRMIRSDEGDCIRPEQHVARTIHASLDVPWFLNEYGVGHRGSLMNKDAVLEGKARMHGEAHFVLHIPCSLRDAALKLDESISLRAFLDFGHGLFYNRAEASWGTLLRMANENGYVILGMDWRGMSSFDLPVVIKTLMSKPSLFESIRDNLIQGYANKLALQHFARHDLLTMDWISFDKNPIPLHSDQQPVSIFYGVSQGGILGAGFTALLAATNLIDRAVLGVPGTPFALIMSRSMDFVGYDAIMLLNFYNNRQVRIFLSLAQMLWDSCEGAGFLAPPLQYKMPRILIQAGLGDSVVPTIAAEALARALGAAVLPSNPRKFIFGIPTEPAAEGDLLGPHVTITELLYKKENASLPMSDDYSAVVDNPVHWCVREDPTMIKQVEEFINTGRIIDVCVDDGCIRDNADHC